MHIPTFCSASLFQEDYLFSFSFKTEFNDSEKCPCAVFEITISGTPYISRDNTFFITCILFKKWAGDVYTYRISQVIGMLTISLSTLTWVYNKDDWMCVCVCKEELFIHAVP